ncbi:MAG: hypothetical protein K2Q97_20630 [Burkholderiaceae bacterium]|nr:hypothetical protein [Burkholderiaceae bacterium]
MHAAVERGNEARVPSARNRPSCAPWGVETGWIRGAKPIGLAAFGITLIEPGQAIEVTSPVNALPQIA